MVSKLIRKTPTKSIKDHHQRRHRRKRSPIKAVSSIIVASINNSLHSCHRHLIKLFSKLARIGTPKNKTEINNKKKKKKNYSHSRKRNNKKTPKSISRNGYQILPKFDVDTNTITTRRTLFPNLLPPPEFPEKRTLILDLDETLIHSTPEPAPEKYDFIVCPLIDGVRMDFYVLKRPYVDEFLEFVSKKFEIVIFTAGLEEYASLVLNRLDRNGLISHRLYRSSCREVDGKFVKDLGEVGRDLRRVAIIDDNPNAYAFNPENAIPVKPFIDDVADTELEKLMGFLEGCDEAEDMKDVVKQYLAGEIEGNIYGV